MDLLTNLGIDWGVLIAQTVNFLIIMGILTYFVYRPVMNVIDARTARIKKSMEEADAIDNQTKDLERLRREELSKIDKEAGVILEKAKQEAERARKDILEKAQREAAAILEKGQKELEHERARVFSEVQDTLNTVILRATEKLLAREFKSDDQKRILQSIKDDVPSLLK